MLVVLLTGCQAAPPPSENADIKKLMQRARPPILRDGADDKDLLGWQELMEKRRLAEEQRLAAQPKVTAAFVDLPIRDALIEISTQSKIPVVADHTVQGEVTLNITDVPFETALRLIAFAGHYSYSTDGQSYYVGTIDPNSPTYALLTTTRQIPTYRAPAKLVAALNKAYASYLSFAEGVNVVTITGPSSVVDRIEADVRTLDRPPVQVMIEVLVVETKNGSDFDAGLDYSKLTAEGTHTARTDNNPNTPNTTTTDLVARLTVAFNLLAAKNMAVVRSNPKIVTTDGTTAEIRSLVEHYVLIQQAGTALVSQNLEIIKSGTTLKVTPTVTRNDEIELALEPEVADVIGVSQEIDGTLPVISRRGVKSSVRVKNGDVVIIGGLYEEGMRELAKGIPILKDLPVVSLFTGKEEKQSRTTELLIFVSPRILK